MDILCLQETHRLDPNVIQPWLAKHNLKILANAPSVKEADIRFKSGTAILTHTLIQSLLQTSAKISVPNRAQTIKLKLP